MTHSGYIKLRATAPEVRIGDVEYNVGRIIGLVLKAESEKIDCIVFPELSLTGYTCADLFQQSLLLQSSEEGVKKIAEALKETDILVAVGVPVCVDTARYNCAVIICRGKILGIVPKSHLPNYAEFYEKRWFDSGLGLPLRKISYAGQETNFGTEQIFLHKSVKIGVEICEDLWVPQPPSGGLAMAGAEVILNLSASDETIGKHDYLVSLISQQSARCRCAYAYASAGWGESSTDLVFSGKAMIGYDGIVFGTHHRFAKGMIEETRYLDIEKLRLDRYKYNSFSDNIQSGRYTVVPSEAAISADGDFESIPDDYTPEKMPFVPSDKARLKERCEEISDIQAYGLMRRLDAIGCRRVVLGISGGLDSTLALLVAVRAFDKLSIPRSGIIAVTMPGLATTSRTRNNAFSLMERLGVSIKEIPIGEAVARHFKDIGQDPDKFDATYENSQARERTQILMDLANKENAIVIGTGDMSELALGWCTYNGDHMSMYGVNASVPKTLIRHLVKWYVTESEGELASTLQDIIETPISPELVPAKDDTIAQKTEDLVGPYELHDFFLFHFLRNSFSPVKIYRLAVKAFAGDYDEETILKWLKVFISRFFSQQFKRSCMPDGPKVGSVSLSPRGDWRMPSDASKNLWLQELDNIR